MTQAIQPFRRHRVASLLVLAVILLGPGLSPAYLVPPALSLRQLEAEAHVIFKGEAVASEAVEDAWFKIIGGFAPRETRFRMTSIIKGDIAPGDLRFRHYQRANDHRGFMHQQPQFYEFEPGKTYIVCAHQTPDGLRQTRRAHTGKMDLGVLRCRDARPVSGKSLPEIYWTELMLLRDSPVAADVVYAIKQCEEMSGVSEMGATRDFSRLDVLHAFHTLMHRPEPEVALAAIALIGDGSPYLRDDTLPFWLGTIGVPNPGRGQMDPGTRNPGGALCWRELVEVANGNAPPQVRALAIRALGLVKAREIHRPIDQWVKDPAPAVRAAAVLVSADFDSRHPYAKTQFGKFVKDPASEVRKGAAYAMGVTQNPHVLPLIVDLLRDSEKEVRMAAQQSLTSFSPEMPAVAAALKADLGNPNTHPLSLLALARQNPAPYLDDLAKVIIEKPTPADWSGGEIPAFTAWKLLFRHARAQPAEDARAGKLDHYFDALEQVGDYSSSEPRDLYALYLQRGLTARAKAYRARVAKDRAYDMDYFFNKVDENPKAYEGP